MFFKSERFRMVWLPSSHCQISSPCFVLGSKSHTASGKGDVGSRHVPSDANLAGGNSNIFYFHPDIWGRWTHLDSYLSDGLVQPPTRNNLSTFSFSCAEKNIPGDLKATRSFFDTFLEVVVSQGSLNYPLWRNQPLHIYGNVEVIPLFLTMHCLGW